MTKSRNKYVVIATIPFPIFLDPLVSITFIVAITTSILSELWLIQIIFLMSCRLYLALHDVTLQISDFKNVIGNSVQG